MEDLDMSLNDPALKAPAPAVAMTPVASFNNTNGSKIPSTKVPALLPPKAPRKQLPSNSSITEEERVEEKEHFKQIEKQLMKGGDFLDESGYSGDAECGGGELPIQLLYRLEAAAAAEKKLMHSLHYEEEDMPLLLMNRTEEDMSNSFSELPAVQAPAVQAPEISSTKANPDASSPQAASISETAETSVKERAAERSDAITVTRSLLEDEEEEEENENDDDEREKENENNLFKLPYLYSQDKENSILSLMTAAIPSPEAAAANEKSLPPTSPQNFYRSGAISACCTLGTEAKASPFFDDSKDHNQDEIKDPEPAEGTDDKANLDGKTKDSPKIVSDGLLNIMTSGCTGANPAAKEAITENLVALEAGWSGIRTTVNERMTDLEESWRSWNLNSLLQFTSPKKTAPEETAIEVSIDLDDDKCTTPITMGKTTILTTPPSLATGQPHVSRKNELCCGENITPKAIFKTDLFPNKLPGDSFPKGHPMHAVLSALSMEKEESATYHATPDEVLAEFLAAPHDEGASTNEDLEKKIQIGTTESDVPFHLKNQLLDISVVEPRSNSSSPQNKQNQRKALEISRDDSEGGKVILDADEWDPVEPDDDESVELDLSREPVKKDGFFYKQKKGGHVIRSPTSVLIQI